jgi:hypothetical protein
LIFVGAGTAIDFLMQRFSKIRIYQIDVLIPTVRLLKEMIIPQIIEPISLECDLLAIPWMEMTTGRLNIRMASILYEEADKAVLMDLGIRDEVRD